MTDIHDLKLLFQEKLKENGDVVEKYNNMPIAEFLDILFRFLGQSDILDILRVVAPHSTPFCYYRWEVNS